MIDGRTDGQTDGRAHGRVGGQGGGRADGQADGRMGGWADGRTGGRTGRIVAHWSEESVNRQTFVNNGSIQCDNLPADAAALQRLATF